jgi:hypothetical protein
MMKIVSFIVREGDALPAGKLRSCWRLLDGSTYMLVEVPV